MAEEQGQQEQESGLLARSIDGDTVFGKCDDSLAELRMPGEVVLDLERRWRADGYPNLSAWRRELYYVALYGVDHVANLRAHRSRSAFGNVGRMSQPTQGNGTKGGAE